MSVDVPFKLPGEFYDSESVVPFPWAYPASTFKTPQVSDSVQFFDNAGTSVHASAGPHAAIVTATYPDGAVDLKVFGSGGVDSREICVPHRSFSALRYWDWKK